MAIQKYTNNATDTLNGAITNVQTTITLNDASEFPSIGAGEQYYATITDGTNLEIVLVTDDASTPTLTVTRAQQGTTAQAFADGVTVSHRYTAADGDNWVQRADTGSVDLSGATEFKIPTDAAPTVNADGEIALDTTVTDFSHGVVKYYGGEEMGVVAMPIAQFTTPTDGYVVSYDATDDEFKLVAGGGGLAAVVDDPTPQLGGDLDVNGNQITGAIDLDSSGNIELRLGDSGGLDRVRIRDGGDVVQALIDSDGNIQATSISFDLGSSLLSDFEEGTWTPTFDFSTTGNLSVSYAVQKGTYTRVGSTIVATFFIRCTPTFTTSSGIIEIPGLPFTPSDPAYGVVYHTAGVTYPAGRVTVVAEAPTALNYVQLLTVGSATAAANLSSTSVATGVQIEFRSTVIYRV